MSVAIPGLLISLGALFRYVMPWALRLAYGVTLGVVLSKLADVVGSAPWPVNRLEGPIRGVDNKIEDGLAAFARVNEAAFSEVISGAGDLTLSMAESYKDDALTLYHAVDSLIGSIIPGQVKAGTATIEQTVTRTERARRASTAEIWKGIDDTGALGKARDKTEAGARERGIDRVDARIDALVLPQLRALGARIDSWAGYTWRNIRALKRRLARVETAVGAAAITAIAIRVLTRRMPWHRCTNVRAFNRFLCRSPIGALDDLLGLLAGTALLALALDPRALARAATKVTGGLEGIIRETALR